MAKSAYIGVKTEIPEYEEVVINITADNYMEYFTSDTLTTERDEDHFVFFWDNDRIINGTTGDAETAAARAWGFFELEALCNIEKLSFDFSGQLSHPYVTINVWYGAAGELENEVNIDSDNTHFEGSMKVGDVCWVDFYEACFLEAGDITISNIQITIKVPKTNTTTISITPDNINDYFIDLSNFYIGADSSTNYPFYWKNGKIVNAPTEQSDPLEYPVSYTWWIEFKSAIKQQTISFDVKQGTYFYPMKISVYDSNDNEKISDYYPAEKNFKFEHTFTEIGEYVFFGFEVGQGAPEGDFEISNFTTSIVTNSVEIKEIARFVSDIYIGVPTEIINPEDMIVNITPDNINDYFVTSDDWEKISDDVPLDNPDTFHFGWENNTIINSDTVGDSYPDSTGIGMGEIASFELIAKDNIQNLQFDITYFDYGNAPYHQFSVDVYDEQGEWMEDASINLLHGEESHVSFNQPIQENWRLHFFIDSWVMTRGAYTISNIKITKKRNTKIVHITPDNFNNYFSDTDEFPTDGSLQPNFLYFFWKDGKLVNSDISNAMTGGTCTAMLFFTPKIDINFSFKFNGTYNEVFHPYFEVCDLDFNYIRDAVIDEETGELNCQLNQGEILSGFYEDSGLTEGEVFFSDIKIEFFNTDTIIQNTARRVKKAYVGDQNGIAQLFFDQPEYLKDFKYKANSNGTYTLTDWKGTYNGEPSTEIIVPDYDTIIL